MARIEVSGINIDYELLGRPSAAAVALTPGGRFSREIGGLRELADGLVDGGRRVLLWDRPNSGNSDLCFEGRTESELQGAILTQLIHVLDLGPTAVGGGSSGSRTALFAAVHAPQAVSHLMLWWISGGVISTLVIGADYCGGPAAAARIGGMAAVAQLPHWADQVERDPRKRDVLLAMDPEAFIAKMERWSAAFVASDQSPVPGVLPEHFAKLTMPTLVIRGDEKDIAHPASIAEWVHRLIPQSVLSDPPWEADMAQKRLAAFVGRQADTPFVDWPRLAPAILEFTS